MHVYSMTSDSLTENANVVKEALLARLEKDGHLKTPADELSKQYVALVHEPRWFGRLFASVLAKEDRNNLRVTIGKV